MERAAALAAEQGLLEVPVPRVLHFRYAIPCAVLSAAAGSILAVPELRRDGPVVVVGVAALVGAVVVAIDWRVHATACPRAAIAVVTSVRSGERDEHFAGLRDVSGRTAEISVDEKLVRRLYRNLVGVAVIRGGTLVDFHRIRGV